MSENDEDFVNKGICEEKHKAVNEKFVDLKANIHTSKESLSNRLDEVDAALLGDRRTPGGLLRDFVDIRNELTRYEKGINKELKHHKENIAKDMKFMGWKIWIAIVLATLAVGGRISGISIKDLFQKKPTPVVTTAPVIEEDDNNAVPKVIKELVIEESK